MVGICEVIEANGLQDSTMQVAFALVGLGILIKMAFFPFHAWLPIPTVMRYHHIEPTCSSGYQGNDLRHDSYGPYRVRC